MTVGLGGDHVDLNTAVAESDAVTQYTITWCTADKKQKTCTAEKQNKGVSERSNS